MSAVQISTIILFLIISFMVVYKIVNTPSITRATEIKDLLDKISGKILDVMYNTIRESDPSKQLDFTDFSSIVVGSMIDNAWDYVENELPKQIGDDKELAIISSFITREHIENLVQNLIDNNNLQNIIADTFTKYYLKKFDDMEKEDKELSKLADEYERETIEVPEYNGEHDKSEYDIARENFVGNEPKDEVVYTEDDETIEKVETQDIFDPLEEDDLK